MHKKPSNLNHKTLSTTGVLITNLGTPDEATPKALKRYLKEFLWDPRVVEIPRLVWWMILNGFVLTTRPAKSAEAYQQIWTDEGSPLLVIAKKQKAAIQQELEKRFKGPVKVALGMRYGNPSIELALDELREANVSRIVVLPLYPQYAAATTGSTLDAIAETLKEWRYVPELRFVNHYHDNSDYIDAMAESIQKFWDKNGKSKKLFYSFHGVPKRTLTAGDPYFCQCHKTARLISEKLGLEEGEWIIAFQSLFGKDEWVRPYSNETLQKLGSEGLESVDVVCPGFSADCLETLEEMAVENKAVFEEAGGGQYRYIPALNDEPSHIAALSQLIENNMQGWPGLYEYDESSLNEAAGACAQRAISLGAKQ